MIVMQRFFCRKPQDFPTNPERRERRMRSVLPTTRFLRFTRSGVSAAGANGAEGDWSPALLGSQPITVGWVQRRTKLRTLCKYRLDTSTGARRRRSAGFSPGSGASRHLAFSQSVTSLYFAVQKKRYGGSRTQKVQGFQPCRGFGARSPDRGLGWEPQAGFRAAALTAVWGGALTGVGGEEFQVVFMEVVWGVGMG